LCWGLFREVGRKETPGKESGRVVVLGTGVGDSVVQDSRTEGDNREGAKERRQNE
jgi:hypothetical protein